MNKIENLKYNEWVSLKKLTYPEKGINGYIYSHETRCNGQIVAVLPFRYSNNEMEYLVRHEYTPSWGLEELYESSITGGVENNNSKETAVHEMEEETGYNINEDELIYLGWSFGVKSSDTVYYLYAVDLTNKDKSDAKGDGTGLENKAHNEWQISIDNVVDPIFCILYLRFFRTFKN